jgi:glycosyltransferase involved in cell wall biosynthesis
MDDDRGLRLALDLPLPDEVAIGSGTALFVCGTCFHTEQRVRALSLTVDGEPQPVRAHSMPRIDHFRSLHPGVDPYALLATDPRLHAYSSGFWGLAELGAGAVELGLEAELDDGTKVGRALTSIAAPGYPDPVPAPKPAVSGAPLVTICMATYEPPPELFRRQVESIRAQTHRNWLCVISDDGSSAAAIARMRAVIGDDARFVISPADRRLGFYLNFERALALAPAATTYVAFSDQDDRWYPEKLEALIGEIGDAQLIYSDARVIVSDGTPVSDTYWVTRRHNHDALGELLITNSVTGAAALFRRELLDVALPFPPAQFTHFHDHWLAVVALALGRIAFVDRPLYDYVQHGDATLGHATANFMPPLSRRVRNLGRPPRERIAVWRSHYFTDVCRLMQWATVLRTRCADRMASDKRRALEWFLASDDSLKVLAGMWRRGAHELLGRSRTLGGEWMLAYALTWRRLLTATVRERPSRHLRLDAVPPAALVTSPTSQG